MYFGFRISFPVPSIDVIVIRLILQRAKNLSYYPVALPFASGVFHLALLTSRTVILQDSFKSWCLLESLGGFVKNGDTFLLLRNLLL